MNKEGKALKHRLRGMKRLAEALSYLGWTAKEVPDFQFDGNPGAYVIGTHACAGLIISVIEEFNRKEEDKTKADEDKVS